MRLNKSILLLLTVLPLAGCQSGVTNIPVSPDSEMGKQMLEMDAKGRAMQNAPLYSKTIQEFETANSGKCADIVFDNLQEPGQRISKYVRLYMMEGKSSTCGSKLYCVRLTFDDSANTVVKRTEVLFGQDDVLSLREKAMEFIRYAQTGEVQQMLAITSPLSHATETDSMHSLYADQVVPQFQGKSVTWEKRSTPTIDEAKNVGLIVTGTAQGTNTFSFDLAVYKENGKFVVTAIQKHH